ncbi:MAG: acetyl-CoA C-acetyltransferase [Acidobacteriia bacterium]|nr:acetyl-CoA C-acetyltransferase [Terriglobia bacterium]
MTSSRPSVVITAAVRTPIGKFLGSLRKVSAPRLGAIVVKEVVQRAGLKPEQIDECILGNVVQAGLGQNPARQAALHGGLLPAVGAFTVNKVCGSGLKAVGLAVQAIQCQDQEIVVAGGMESMSNAPFLIPKLRDGYRLGHGEVLDAMIHDGLWDAYEDFHMGMTGELVAGKYKVTRDEMDAYAVESHRRASAAIRECHFQSQITPVEIKSRQGVTAVTTDESPREDCSLESLRALKPVFKKDGTITAGNAPGTNDGAAALVLTSEDKARQLHLPILARVVGQATAGLEPQWVMMTPVPAVRKLLPKIGWKKEEVDLWELNEAFAVQSVVVIRKLELDPARVNVNGGAVALGHPIGASGARILVTLLYEMIRRDLRRGVATLCMGGGNGFALAIER